MVRVFVNVNANVKVNISLEEGSLDGDGASTRLFSFVN